MTLLFDQLITPHLTFRNSTGLVMQALTELDFCHFYIAWWATLWALTKTITHTDTTNVLLYYPMTTTKFLPTSLRQLWTCLLKKKLKTHIYYQPCAYDPHPLRTSPYDLTPNSNGPSLIKKMNPVLTTNFPLWTYNYCQLTPYASNPTTNSPKNQPICPKLTTPHTSTPTINPYIHHHYQLAHDQTYIPTLTNNLFLQSYVYYHLTAYGILPLPTYPYWPKLYAPHPL